MLRVYYAGKSGSIDGTLQGYITLYRVQKMSASFDFVSIKKNINSTVKKCRRQRSIKSGSLTVCTVKLKTFSLALSRCIYIYLVYLYVCI